MPIPPIFTTQISTTTHILKLDGDAIRTLLANSNITIPRYAEILFCPNYTLDRGDEIPIDANDPIQIIWKTSP